MKKRKREDATSRTTRQRFQSDEDVRLMGYKKDQHWVRKDKELWSQLSEVSSWEREVLDLRTKISRPIRRRA